ncbi:MAG: MOSC domain-containing protein [Dongiaceae bacterium]
MSSVIEADHPSRVTHRTGGLDAVVSGLWIYPVQSLRGQPLQHASFAAAGLPGDRGYGIADLASGLVVGSSRPGWNDLITWEARYLGPVLADAPLPAVEIAFPDGASLRSTDPDCDRVLSDRLGKAVRLVLNDNSIAKRRYDLAPCHFLTTATLKELQKAYPEGNFDPARFRPNLLLDCGATSGFIEQQWIGRKLACGDTVFTVTEDCARCALTVRAQGNLPKDPRILHTVTQMNRTFAGSYATVSNPGTLTLGARAVLDG